MKQMIIYFSGSTGFQQLLNKQAIPHNTDFAGVYTFSQAADYSRILIHFFKHIKDKGLIMCHPGLQQDLHPDDAIAIARFHEYTYLASEQFALDCQSYGVQLKKFSLA